MLALLNGLGLIVVIVAVVFLLLNVRKLPELWSGVRQGVREFAKVSQDLESELRVKPNDPVGEALSHDNRTTEFGAPRPSDMESDLIVWLAQGFGVGRIRFAPGTWGSLVGVVWALLLLGPGSMLFYVLGILASSLAAVWLCGAAEKILGEHDPGSVVLDEIVAVPLALGGYAGLWWWQAGELPSPARLAQWWPAALAAFLLFRLFDIWKPWPIRALQKLPGGWGVVADDLAAGLAAALVLGFGTQGAFVVQLLRG